MRGCAAHGFSEEALRVRAFQVSSHDSRDGGIILAVGKDREEIEAIARQDPFVTHGLADVRVIEFRASQRAENVQAALDKEAARWPPRPLL
jgi:hypothetical protein